jgi:hypothetical protein
MIIFSGFMLHSISKATIFASTLLNKFIIEENMKLMRQGFDPCDRIRALLLLKGRNKIDFFCISNHFLLILNVLLMNYFGIVNLVYIFYLCIFNPIKLSVMDCPGCKKGEYVKSGFVKGRQRYKCKSCGYYIV